MYLRVYLLGLFAAIFAIGCSSFERDWKMAKNQSVDGIEGRWVGRWHSDYNQHNGVLRCLISKKSGNLHETRFHAKYKLGLLTISYPYDTDMSITQKGASYAFKGEADLGWLAGGIYRYDGNGTSASIEMNYRASKDFGTFKLQRAKEGE